MNQPEFLLESGVKVKTHEKLEEDGVGMLVAGKYLAARKSNAVGTIAGVVGGHGGDVYFVEHRVDPDDLSADPDSVAAYGFWEFELA